MSPLPSSAPSCLASSADPGSTQKLWPGGSSPPGFFILASRLRRCRQIARAHHVVRAPHACPVVAGAEEAADRAGLDAQGVGLLEGHPGVIGVAAGAAVD